MQQMPLSNLLPQPIEEPSQPVAIMDAMLFARNCETLIHQHLMERGTRIDPATRYLLAQVRDRAGVVAKRLSGMVDACGDETKV